MRTVFLLVVILFSITVLTAQSTPKFTAAQRDAALSEIEAKFQELYVFPEMRSTIIKKIRDAKLAGRYEVEDPRIFADRVTTDLREVAHDEHLSLAVDSAAYAAAIAPPKSDAGEEAFRRRRAIRNDHGLTEMRILPGNIRYLRITHFEWVPDETGRAYDAAMKFLKDGDAWIIDLRGNGGGTSSAAQYLSSHFFDPGTATFISYAGSEPPERSFVLDHLPAGRLKGKPLYVLIDRNVGSAAEAVAYNLQQFKLAELIGSRTVGAANNNKLLPIAPNFILSISYGRPVHVLTKTNWEGVGVIPNIECPPTQALDLAQSIALKRLAASNASPEQLVEYQWYVTSAEARVKPVAVAVDQLKKWAGHFGQTNVGYGELTITLEGGDLWLVRPDRPAARLSPLTTDGLFAIEGNEQLRARFMGKTVQLLWWNDPQPRTFERN